MGAISGKINSISTKLNEKSATAPAATATQTANEPKKEGTN
ncbi:glyoxal oxidase-like protein [Lactobacillus phage S16]|nr:glyoxal oxidase-like protein [Lactobacillus phage S16]